MSNLLDTINDIFGFHPDDPSCICPRCFHWIYYGQCAIVDISGKELKPETRGKEARKNPVPLEDYSISAVVYRVCYVCQYHIPYNYEQGPNIFLSVIGYNISGKSHYLTSFKHQLQEEMSRNPDFYTFSSLKPEAEQLFEKDYAQPLYEENEEILGTKQARQIPDPLLLLRFQGRRPEQREFNLIIYDIAGEDFASRKTLRDVGRFVRYTNAFIFVVDPVTINRVFQDLEPALQDRFNRLYGPDKSSRAPHKCFSDVMNAFPATNTRKFRWPPVGYPIAIMLSKADLVQNLVPTSSLIKNSKLIGEIRNSTSQWSDTEDKKIDNEYLEGIDDVDKKVRDFLDLTGQGGFLGLINRFHHVKFFAVSSTGSTSDDSHKFPFVKPNRCLDPVVWLLDVLDFKLF